MTAVTTVEARGPRNLGCSRRMADTVTPKTGGVG